MIRNHNNRRREQGVDLGAIACRKRLAKRRKQREKAYVQDVNKLVYFTNKEFHSSSFASKIENLLTSKWTENPNKFMIQSKLSPKKYDRVQKLICQFERR